MPSASSDRVHATEAALALVAQLRAAHGPLLFMLSHGCCDGSTPMCLTVAELTPGAGDVLLGQVAGDVPFWTSRAQRDYLAALHLTLDVEPGNNGAYSLEDGMGQRFVMRLRLLGDDEAAALAGG